MKEPADLVIFILENFEEYIEENDNPIDTTIKILKDLKKKTKKEKT